MTRFLLTLLCAQLAALAVSCDGPPSGLSTTEAYNAARQAARDGDMDLATDLLAEAADGGHLDALNSLARGYKDGVLFVGMVTPNQVISIRPSQRRAARYRRAYDRALADSVRAGHPRALLLAAAELMGPRMAVEKREDLPAEIRERYWDAVDMDSVRTLYGQVDSADLYGMDLLAFAQLGGALGDTTVMMTLYDRAVAEGASGACIYKIQALYGPTDFHSAAGLADHFDRMIACDPALLAEGSSSLAHIRQSAASGVARSAEMLDSLKTLGLFERYPYLAASSQ